MTALKIYTLKSCDTCKKALKWLAETGQNFENHDIRADGLDFSQIAPIVETLGWETVVNRRSTTWRGLTDAEKTDLDNKKAIGLILAHPTLMKRPVFTDGSTMVAGFDTQAKAALGELMEQPG